MISRFQGCLVGLAIGDALGAPYEFKKPGFRVSPDFGRGVFGTKPGHPTDDSTLAAACADSLIKLGYLDPSDYAARVVEFSQSNPPDIGGQTRLAANDHARGRTPRETTSAGNGALMAVAPIGLAYAYGNAAEVGRMFSDVTHPNDQSRHACGYLAGTIASYVRGGTDRPFVWDSPYASIASAQDAASSASMGWAPLTVTLAMDCVRSADKPERAVAALMDLIALGGDTDTNAAVAGALLGARFGLAAWPEHLRRTLHGYDEWLVRGLHLMDVALHLAR